MSTALQRERWSLHVEFDSVEEQNGEPDYGDDEMFLFALWVGRSFGGLHEEIKEVMAWEGRKLEVTSFVLDWLNSAVNHLTMMAIPKEIRIVRNEGR